MTDINKDLGDIWDKTKKKTEDLVDRTVDKIDDLKDTAHDRTVDKMEDNISPRLYLRTGRRGQIRA